MPNPSPAAPRSLAIVCNSLPPYRVHAHRRFAAEIPELELLTLNTHLDNSRNWQVDLPPEIGVVDLSNGDLVASKSRHLREWQRGGKAIEQLKARRAAAVIVNGYNDAGRMRILRWCKRNNIPVFVWADSNVFSESRISPLKRFAKRLFIGNVLRYVTGLFACGSRGRDYWKLYGARDEQIFISPYEPDYAQIESITSSEVEHARAEFNLPASRRYLIYSGRFVSVKRVDLLIDAFARLANERPDWDLVLLGDGELKASLAERIPKELASRVHWIGFQADQRQVSRIYRCCDVLALPSDYEPWALVINEAAAAGLAIVASEAVAAAVEIVEPGKNGFRFEVGNLDALTSALRQVTEAGAIDALKSASPQVLAKWRRVGDPVRGIREALYYAKVL